jgi:ergothioneine biosynthesis protein EgtB
MLGGADALYDSRTVAHDTRWSLPLPGVEATRAYLVDTLDATLEQLARAPDEEGALYFFKLSLFHECMHEEAFAYTWQTLGYPAAAEHWRVAPVAREPHRVDVGAGTVMVGSARTSAFVFDNEMWEHEVALDDYQIDCDPVTNAQFAAFVDSGGYADPQWWTPGAFAALRAEQRAMPRYWRRSQGQLQARTFDAWSDVDPDAPVVNVSAHEAEAWCRWAGRQLPSEAQWVRAARVASGFAWGDRVWEWTASPFEALAGFEPGPYREYSAPFFGTHRVVRGGSFATPRAMVDDRFRNYYEPHRDDIFVGFRSCAAPAQAAFAVG